MDTRSQVLHFLLNVELETHIVRSRDTQVNKHPAQEVVVRVKFVSLRQFCLIIDTQVFYFWQRHYIQLFTPIIKKCCYKLMANALKLLCFQLTTLFTLLECQMVTSDDLSGVVVYIFKVIKTRSTLQDFTISLQRFKLCGISFLIKNIEELFVSIIV